MNSEAEERNAPIAMGLWPDAGQRTEALRVRNRDRDRTVPLSELDAVIDCPPMTSVPAAPAWLLGVAAYKGALLPVVDLAAACGQRGSAAGEAGERLLLVEAGDHRIGFSVDAIESRTLDPTPSDGSTIALRLLAARLLGAVAAGDLDPAEPTAT